MLSLPGQRGIEAKIFGLGLGLVASALGIVLVLIQWPRSHEGCPRGFVVSHQKHVIYVTFFSDRKLLLALYSIEVNFWLVHWHGCDCHILGVISWYWHILCWSASVHGALFVTYVISLASTSASLFRGLVNMPAHLRPSAGPYKLCHSPPQQCICRRAKHGFTSKPNYISLDDGDTRLWTESLESDKPIMSPPNLSADKSVMLGLPWPCWYAATPNK